MTRSGPSYDVVVADGVPDLDRRLSDELDRVNAAATRGVAPARELFRWDGVPTAGEADVHLRKEL